MWSEMESTDNKKHMLLQLVLIVGAYIGYTT